MVQIASLSIPSRRRLNRREWVGLVMVLSLMLVTIMLYLSTDNGAVTLTIEQHHKLMQSSVTVNTTAAAAAAAAAAVASDSATLLSASSSPEEKVLASSAPTIIDIPEKSSATSNNNVQEEGDSEINDYPTLFPRVDAALAIRPTYGKHRPSQQQVIFSFARGYKLHDYLPFVSSLFAQDYAGDLVLGVSSDLSTELRDYFQYLTRQHPGVVIYEIPLSCISVKIRTHCQTVGMFRVGDTVLADTRLHREVAQLRFEYYWAWTSLYSSTSYMWLLDSRDMYFQRHPMIQSGLLGGHNSTMPSATTLHVFEESSSQPIWKQKSNRLWIRRAYGADIFKKMKHQTVVCSGSTFGGQPAIEWYTRAMVHQFDVTNCTIYGCDQGHHNYLIRQNKLVDAGANHVTNVEIHKQGEGVVNTLGLLVTNVGNLTALGLLTDKMEVLNNDRTTVSPIIHQFDRDPHFLGIIEGRKRGLLKEWNHLAKSK